MQFPWYTARPQHLLIAQHEGKIHICPSSFAFSLPVSTSPLLLQYQFTALWIPDEGWDTDYQGDQSTPSNNFHPPSIRLINYGKACAVPPCNDLPHPLIPLYQQSQRGRWDICVQPLDTDTLLTYSHSQAGTFTLWLCNQTAKVDYIRKLIPDSDTETYVRPKTILV